MLRISVNLDRFTASLFASVPGLFILRNTVFVKLCYWLISQIDVMYRLFTRNQVDTPQIFTEIRMAFTKITLELRWLLAEWMTWQVIIPVLYIYWIRNYVCYSQTALYVRRMGSGINTDISIWHSWVQQIAPEETLVLYDVTALFTCISISDSSKLPYSAK